MEDQETLGEVAGPAPFEYPDEPTTSVQGNSSRSADQDRSVDQDQSLNGLYSNPFHQVIDIIDIDD